MIWDRVVDIGRDSGGSQMIANSVAMRRTDDEKVSDVIGAAGIPRQDDAGIGKRAAISGCDFAAAGVPAVQVRQLGAQHRRLDLVEAAVASPGYGSVILCRPPVLP